MADPVSPVWFKLFASCVIVKGKSKSLVYDLERSAFYDIPNELLEILESAAKGMDLVSIKNILNEGSGDFVQSFFDQFVDQEIGFYTSDPDAFPDIDFTWDYPGLVTSSIVEIDDLHQYDVSDVFLQLSDLGCKAIQVRLLKALPEAVLYKILSWFNNSRINHIELIIPADHPVNSQYLSGLAERQPRLQRVLVYGALEDKIIRNDSRKDDLPLIYLRKDIRAETDEIIKVERFRTNIQMYAEALKYNSGLNRKVCIDSCGEIKNYLTHRHSFGNAKTDRVRDIVNKTAFQKKWFISNDVIEVCKHCQYRYACVSNSDILSKDNKFYKTEMCGFDPEKNTWNMQ